MSLKDWSLSTIVMTLILYPMGKCLLFRRALCLIIRQHYIVMWPESLALFVPLCPVWQHQSWGDSEHRSSAGRKDRAERAAQAETNSRNWPAGSAQHGTVHRLHKLSTWQITQHSPVSTLTWQTCAPFKGLSNVFARNVQCLSLCIMSTEFTHYSCAPKCF